MSRLAFNQALPLCPSRAIVSQPHDRHVTHDKQHVRMSMQISRRSFLLQTPAISTIATMILCDAGDLRAQLSEFASKIPTRGMSDVYYPNFFEGEWTVSRELFSVQTQPGGVPDMPGHAALGSRAIKKLKESVGRRDTYNIRFVMHRGKIIEDRLFNSRNEASVDHPGVRISCTWDRDNPNVLTVAGAGAASSGTQEIVVTKRAFVNGPNGQGTFVSSEYARIVDVEDDGALLGFGRPPSVYARRRIVRYRVNSLSDKLIPDGMDRLIVDYLYPPSPSDAAVAVTLKYREFMNSKVVR